MDNPCSGGISDGIGNNATTISGALVPATISAAAVADRRFVSDSEREREIETHRIRNDHITLPEIILDPYPYSSFSGYLSLESRSHDDTSDVAVWPSAKLYDNIIIIRMDYICATSVFHAKHGWPKRNTHRFDCGARNDADGMPGIMIFSHLEMRCCPQLHCFDYG